MPNSNPRILKARRARRTKTLNTQHLDRAPRGRFVISRSEVRLLSTAPFASSSYGRFPFSEKRTFPNSFRIRPRASPPAPVGLLRRARATLASMRSILAALLLMPAAALGQCYIHPDTGVTYCISASSCPAGTEWSQSTQACNAAPSPGLVKICTGFDSGTYTPAPWPAQNVSASSGRKAMWIRVNEIVTVAGAVLVTPESAGVTRVFLPLPVETYLNLHDLVGTLSGPDGSSPTLIRSSSGGEAQARFIAATALQTVALRYTYTYVISECLQ